MKKIRILFLILILALVFFIQNALFSDFILDDEAAEKEDKVQKPVYKEEKLSRYTARNIRVEVMPEIKGAVKITWDLHKDSGDDYIVGRSTVITDSANKALQSLSIRVVPAGAKTEVIDSNLKPGAYFYCILARSKIMNKEIELYAGQNYTINPAVIEQDVFQKSENVLPQQVSLIYTRAINKNQVRVSWRGVEAQGTIYEIYRDKNPLDTPGKIRRAKKIQTIVDGRESYTDSGFDESGTYYYAVTTRDLYGNEDLNLIPDQSYSTTGVYISLAQPEPVSSISAGPVDQGIEVRWNKTSTDISEYLIYRYTGAISDSERLSLAAYIGSVPANTNNFIDKNPASGNYYYAVLTKFLDGMVLNDLVKGDNYTTEPVLYNTGKIIELLSISAETYANGIEIKWQMTGSSGNRTYSVFRNESSIKNTDDLNSSDRIATVDIYDLNYFDGEISAGSYYYAVVPDSANNSEIEIKTGVNATAEAVIIEPGRKKIPEKRAVGKIPSIIPEKKIHDTAKPSNVDSIIRKYFISGRYKYTGKELRKILKSSNNQHEKAKAKLYIGRCYVELKAYKSALRYFILRDVNKYFPEEAEFWKVFSLDKIRDKKENLIIKDYNNY
ncbi:MAG: hypothetical protein JW864_18515 [Spirochaetes bacterium]|nr:hypothetical protein [Spirochaetota bacterium]